jgi:hypothetical protein
MPSALDVGVLRLFGQIAGLAGIAVGVFLYVARDFIAKNIFPRLTKQQSTRVILVITFMAGTVALAGIGSWTYVAIHSPKAPDGQGDPPAVAVSIRINVINPAKAPFDVSVEGSVSRAAERYLYLVVDDGNAEYVEPGLGYGYDGGFSAKAYLGIKEDPNSKNKDYSVFAVVCTQEHKEYEQLDRKSVLATSQTIRLHRAK